MEGKQSHNTDLRRKHVLYSEKLYQILFTNPHGSLPSCPRPTSCYLVKQVTAPYLFCPLESSQTVQDSKIYSWNINTEAKDSGNGCQTKKRMSQNILKKKSNTSKRTEKQLNIMETIEKIKPLQVISRVDSTSCSSSLPELPIIRPVSVLIKSLPYYGLTAEVSVGSMATVVFGWWVMEGLCCFILKFLSQIHSVIYKIRLRKNAFFAYTKNATIH